MSFFDVPGWSVPSAPIKESKKRKRPALEHDVEKLRHVEVNIEKLVAKMGEVSHELDVRRKKKGKHEMTAEPRKHQHSPAAKGKGKGQMRTESNGDAGAHSLSGASHVQEKKSQKKRARGETKTDSKPSGSSGASKPPASRNEERQKDLTALQSEMKNSLDGARFRWINEKLYKSDSLSAHDMMRKDPNVFHEYHKGFRHQVESWPSNPVSHYTSLLSSYPLKTVIADLGCGDAMLARSLIPRGLTVLSYDLVSDGVFVTEADIFGSLPLPGSEDDENTEEIHEGRGQVVDVVICALSLMGTNWPRCIREAWRILRAGGELKIAEVASRFTDVEAFKSLIGSFGFKLLSTDGRNTHFTLFEFQKVGRKAKSEKEWGKLLSKGDLLKPCEYKRR